MKANLYYFLFATIFFLSSQATKGQNINSNIRYFNAYKYGIDMFGNEVNTNNLTFQEKREDTNISWYLKFKDHESEVTFGLKDKRLDMFIVKTTSKSNADNFIKNLINDHGNPTIENSTSMTWITSTSSCMLLFQDEKYYFVVSRK